MKTIQAKLFLFFSLFMISFVLAGVVLNALLLEQYYIYRNRSILLETSRQIRLLYARDRQSVPEFLRVTDREEGINIALADSSMVIRLSSLPESVDSREQRLPLEIEKLIGQSGSILENSSIYSLVERPGHREREIVLLSMLEGDKYLVLKKSMKGITESVAIANQFSLLAGGLMVILGGIVIFFYSRKLTAPVIEMSSVAESISNLEFNRPVTFQAQDELGSLGRSINRISEKLSTAMDSLRQDVEHRKQLLRNISHELKSPIGVIKGYAEGLKFGVAEDREKTEKYCTVISEECDRMNLMVGELLSLSMLESGMSRPKITSVPAGEVLRRATGKCEPLLKEKNISLEVACPEDLKLEADQELLERAVTNYITNAIHHAEGEKKIRITAEQSGKAVTITVFNTGSPIPEGELENIWKVFYKVDKARTRSYGGHGLGLSIVRLIAELHHGSAAVSNVPSGVQFSLEFPLMPR